MSTVTAQPTLAQHVGLVVRWLDSTNPRTDHEVALRIMKITEEAGEVVSAYVGMTGHNPRKGVTHTLDDVRRELCDVIVSATIALAALAGDGDDAEQILNRHLATRYGRLLARIAETSAGAR